MTRLPALETPRGWWARLRYKTCPECGERFPNGRWQMSIIGYPMHYLWIHQDILPFRRPGESS